MKYKFLRTTAVLISFLFFSDFQLFAHCDGLDGPVVKAAQKSLETGNIKFTLIWIKKDFEQELNNLFEKTLTVRNLSPEAREIADNYFFETAVRLHRTGEGEPFTGLKPAGRDLGPAIPAADLAIETNSSEQVQNLLQQSSEKKLNELFDRVIHAKNFDENNIAAGREFVEAYIQFIHFTEMYYGLSSGGTEIHHEEHEF